MLVAAGGLVYGVSVEGKGAKELGVKRCRPLKFQFILKCNHLFHWGCTTMSDHSVLNGLPYVMRRSLQQPMTDKSDKTLTWNSVTVRDCDSTETYSSMPNYVTLPTIEFIRMEPEHWCMIPDWGSWTSPRLLWQPQVEIIHLSLCTGIDHQVIHNLTSSYIHL